ncbi:MAG: lytic transglycosylase domain-containing protein [Trueperaceae bacterium]|nr:lytic transglycosylase domain-containing protein [Trueperaceae bacterium]
MSLLRRRGPLALVTLLAGSAIALLTWPAAPRVPLPPVHVALVDPYGHPPLEDYGRVQALLRTEDVGALVATADELDGYLAYRVAQLLARSEALPAAERLVWFERVLELRIDDPLERAARRALHAEIGAVAEAAAAAGAPGAAGAAGADERALAAYRLALPDQAAIDGIERLEPDPYRRANAFLQANMVTRALQALDGRAAPSIEAPALRALGRHAEALDAFRRWLAEAPGERSALEGEAWSLFSLERWPEADAAFAALGGATGAYGRGLIAARQGRIDEAVAHMLATGQATRMWLASGWLEARDRFPEAIGVYLRIAESGDRSLADDAAYRAFVLASRAGDAATAARARALLPARSFFALRLGATLDVPAGAPAASDPSAASATARAALELARALMTVQDPEAARGELLFALREASARADGEAREDVIALAEALQAHHGEYRQSQRAAQALLDAGDRDPRVWRLAYPRAYPESVEVHAAAFGVEPELVWAVMRQESAFSPVAVSTSNAQGLMQVIPSTWAWLAELQRESAGDPFVPDDNVRYGAYYLRWLIDHFDGDLELAIASYNRGQGYIGRLFAGDLVGGDKDELYRHIDALETREYLQRVTLHLETYRALYGGDATRLADAER